MDPNEISKEILLTLENAWNQANGKAFGQPFSTPCDFVDITGTLHPQQSSEAIGAAHEGILNSIYKNSRISYELLQAIVIDQNTILSNAKADLEAPIGPLAGKNQSMITLILSKEQDWKIRAFHNTLVRNR